MKTLTLKLPENLFAQIESDARARNLSKSEIVRERLSQKNTAAKSANVSLWKRMSDLVISQDALPADLSENKSHLKNYGKNRSHR